MIAVIGKKFRSSIVIGGKNTYIATDDTAKEAAVAYDRAVLKANRSTSLLNFPDMVHNLEKEVHLDAASGKIINRKKKRGDRFLLENLDASMDTKTYIFVVEMSQ